MKILLLTLTLITLSLFNKYKRPKNIHLRTQTNNTIDLSEYYTIHYKSYPHVNKDSIPLNLNEEKILTALDKSINPNYKLYVVGGWVRDKLLNLSTADMDIIIDATTVGELYNVTMAVYNYTEQTANHTGKLKRPKVQSEYGRISFMIYDTDIDVETMASERHINEPSV